MKQDKTRWFIYRPLRNVKSHERPFNDPHKIKLSPNAREFQKYLVNQIERAYDKHSLDDSTQEIRQTNQTEIENASDKEVQTNLNKAVSAYQLDTSLIVTQDDSNRRLAIKQEQIEQLQNQLKSVESIYLEKISLLQELNNSLRNQLQHYELRLSTTPIRKQMKINSPSRLQMSTPESLRGTKSNRCASPEVIQTKKNEKNQTNTKEMYSQTEIITNPLQEQLDHAMMKIQALEVAKIQLMNMFSTQAESKQTQRGEQRISPPRSIRPKTTRTFIEGEIENIGKDLRLKPEGSHLDQLRKIGCVIQDLKKQLALEQRKKKQKQTPPKNEKQVAEDKKCQGIEFSALQTRIKELEEQNSRLSIDINQVIVNKIKLQEEKIVNLEHEKQQLVEQLQQANRTSFQNQRDWDKLLIDIQMNHNNQLKKLEELNQNENNHIIEENKDLKFQNKNLKQDILSQQNNLSESQRQCKRYEYLINQSETENKNQKRQIQDLIDQLDSANSTKKELEIQIEQHKQTIHSFQSLVQRRQSTFSNSPVRSDMNQSELQDLKRQLIDLEERIKEFKKQLDNNKTLSRKSLDEKNNDLKLAQQTYNRLQTEVENVMDSIKQETNFKMLKRLEQENTPKNKGQIRQEEQNLSRTNMDMNQSMTEQQTFIVQLQEQQRQSSFLKEEQKKLQDQVLTMGQQIENLNQENMMLKQKIAMNDSLENQTKLEESKLENKNLQQRISLLKEELEDIKEQQDDSPKSMQSVQSIGKQDKRTSLISFQQAIRRASVVDERRIIDQLREDLLDQNKIIRTQIMQLQAHEKFQRELEAKIEGLNNTDANQWYNKYCEIQELYSSLSLQFQQIEQVCEEQSNQLEQIQLEGVSTKRPTLMNTKQVDELQTQLNQYETYLQGREEHIINLENYIQQITEQYQQLEKMYSDIQNENNHYKAIQNQQSLIIEELQNGAQS